MKYNYHKENEEPVASSGVQYISDNTAFMRMQTQLEKNDIVNDEFIGRHKARILALDKFAPLSNIRHGQVQIDRIRRIKIDLLQEANLGDLEEATSLDCIADFQISRGMGGFYQQALITQRQEIKEEGGREEKLGRFRRWMHKKPPQEEEQPE